MFKTNKDSIMNTITDCIKNNETYGYGHTSIIVDKNGNCYTVWFPSILEQHYDVRTGNAMNLFIYANRNIEHEKYDSDNEYDYLQDRVLARIEDAEHLLEVTND